MPKLRARRYIGVAGDLGLVHQHAARLGRHQADDHVEAGGLAGAVRPQQPHHFAAGDLQVDPADNLSPFVCLADSFGDQCFIQLSTLPGELVQFNSLPFRGRGLGCGCASVAFDIDAIIATIENQSPAGYSSAGRVGHARRHGGRPGEHVFFRFRSNRRAGRRFPVRPCESMLTLPRAVMRSTCAEPPSGAA